MRPPARDATLKVAVLNLKNGRLEKPGIAKLEAIAGAMGFPPQPWFDEVGERVPDAALARP